MLNVRISEWLDGVRGNSAPSKDTTRKLNISYFYLKKMAKSTGRERTFDCRVKNCSYNGLMSLRGAQANSVRLPNNLLNLKKLNCSNNELTSLPGAMTNLESLNCSNNNLTSIPNGMTNLEYINCSNNNLTSLREAQASFSRLHGAHKNELLRNFMTNVEFLDCSNNKLTSISNGMTNLKELKCSNNNLTSLSEAQTSELVYPMV